MKVGLYGGMANNMYVFAKALVNQGLDICFIRDRGDHFAFSQPLWEDVPCKLDYNEVGKTANWTWEQWTEFEAKHRWEAPEWLADPLKNIECQDVAIKNVLGPLDKTIFNYKTGKLDHWPTVLKLMSNCNILLVCGIEGSILALASGKPFVILPHGGDIRTAAGQHPPKSHNPYTWLVYFMTLRLLRQSYKHSLWIMGHDPAYDTYINGTTLKFIVMPTIVRQRLPRDKRRDRLSSLLNRLGLSVPKAERIGFVPSRIDFFWKGTDRLLRALSRTSGKQKLHFIMSGWGADYQKAKEMALANQVTFLPCTFSKPILYDFYRSVDFVADQFVMGTYGMAAIEAMSCGTPVIMWIDEEASREKGLEPPPVLNAKEEEDIVKILTGILSGQIDLEDQGRMAHDWVKRIHGEESVVARLKDQFMTALSNVT